MTNIPFRYVFRKPTLSEPALRWWHAIRTAVVKQDEKKPHIAIINHILIVAAIR